MSGWLVVGAGVAGSVISARLADVGADVVVVDAGPDVAAGNDLFDALSVTSRVSSPLVQRVVGGPLVPYTSGIGLGGGSGINGMLMSSASAFHHGHRVPAESIDGHDRAMLNGQRMTVWDAYHQLSSGQHLRVMPSTQVSRLVIENGRCVGAVTDSGAELDADQVVMCAGALMSPSILRRSGISHSDPGVGLQDHPSVALTYRRSPSMSFAGPAIAGLERRGAIQLLHLRRLGVVDDGLAGTVVMLMSPRSRGEVVLDEHGDPVVSFDIGSDPNDLHKLAAAVAAVLDDGIDGDVIDVPAHGDLSEWVRERLRSETPTVTHASSGCAMGRVVDRLGRVNGVAGLFVADTSVFPTIPAVNPMMPTVHLAETLVDRWLLSGLV